MKIACPWVRQGGDCGATLVGEAAVEARIRALAPAKHADALLWGWGFLCGSALCALLWALVSR